MELFGIYDKKAMCYLSVLAVNNNVQAYRAFENEVNTSDSLLNKYASDFSLHFIGTFDDKTGKLEAPDIVRVDLEAAACLLNYDKPSFRSGNADATEAASRPAAKERRVGDEVK